MNYRLIISVFSRQHGLEPVPLAVQIPEELARLLMSLTVTRTTLTIDENPAPTSIPLLDFKDLGVNPDLKERPELKRLFPGK